MIHLLFIGTTELLLIGGVALLLFGGKKLPEMMRGLGQGVSEFKKGMKEISDPGQSPAPEAPADGEAQPQEAAQVKAGGQDSGTEDGRERGE